MKTILLVTVVILAACSSVQPPNQPSRLSQEIPESFSTPPNTTELLVSNDRAQQAREAAITEERLYWESLDNITTKVRDEALNLAMCSEVAPNKDECGILKNNYCQVDVLLDSRGGHHKKPFCQELAHNQ